VARTATLSVVSTRLRVRRQAGTPSSKAGRSATNTRSDKHNRLRFAARTSAAAKQRKVRAFIKDDDADTVTAAFALQPVSPAWATCTERVSEACDQDLRNPRHTQSERVTANVTSASAWRSDAAPGSSRCKR
jgi:hypothetical protein